MSFILHCMSSKSFFFAVILSLFSSPYAQAHWSDALKNSEYARLSQDSKTILKEVQNLSIPELKFVKDVLTAEAHWMQNNPQSALDSLSTLKNQPQPIASYTDDGYAWLYKRALLTSLKAKKSLGQNTDFEESQLQAHYPLDTALMSTLNPDVKLSSEQKVQKLRVLALNSAFKHVGGAITSSDIQKSSITESEKCSAYVVYGRSLKSFSEYAQDAINALSTVRDSSHCLEDQKAKSLFYLGNIGKSTQNSDLMVQSYESLAQNYPQHFLADDALNALAQFYKQSQPALSKKYFKKLDDLKNGDMRTEYFFTQGFELYKNKQFNEALKMFDKAHETESPINETYVQALYWKARTLEDMKNNSVGEAKNIYKTILQNYPFSFYAVLASKKLTTDLTVNLPTLSGTLDQENTYFSLARELITNKEYQWARVMIDLAILQNPSIAKTQPQALAKYHIDAENYRESIELASNYFGTGPYGPVSKTSDPMISAFYPQVYKQETQKGYAVSGLPLGAIEGISREESLFKKDATSWVGAKGLMQLMPATARMIQGEVLAHTPTTELTHPLNNILLGSHYLKLMKNKFSDQMPLAIMAYNAGPGNVNKWLRKATADKKLQSLDMFIEEIPFDETRGYVKRVMRSMNVYGHVYNEDFFKKNQFSLSVKNSGDV